MSVLCSFCSLPVSPHDTQTWRKQTVWVGGPKRHGSRLAEDTGEFAHEECVEKAVKGIAPDLTPMF